MKSTSRPSELSGTLLDHFRLTVASHSPQAQCSIHRVWEARVDWDDEVPEAIRKEWSLWRLQLFHLSNVHIP